MPEPTLNSWLSIRSETKYAGAFLSLHSVLSQYCEPIYFPSMERVVVLSEPPANGLNGDQEILAIPNTEGDIRIVTVPKFLEYVSGAGCQVSSESYWAQKSV